MNKVFGTLRRYFASGVLVVVPIILTYIVLRFLFESIDGILRPVIGGVFGYFIPGLGILITVLIILLAGLFTRNLLGARLYRVGDRILARMPIIRPVYSAAKQLLEAIMIPTKGSFKEVAMVEYPRRGAWALCFISNRLLIETEEGTRAYVSVFVPSTPTPISGMVITVPEDQVFTVDMTVEEGVKFLVSGGVTSQKLIRKKKLNSQIENEATGETR